MSETLVAADTFLDLLAESRLLSTEQYQAVLRNLDPFQDYTAEELARMLREDGLLTRYQTERLLEGRSRGFYIDDYKVLEVLGSGGMGWLFEAEERSTGRVVALKVLSEKLDMDPGMMTRIKLEALAGSLLDHPCIVKTLRTGHTGPVHFVVMEFVEGISLHEAVSLSGPLAWPLACHVIRQAAQGLHHAHRARIVHRDVKPANLLVDHAGGTKILDFGLALLPDHKEEEFSLSMIFGHDCVGTPDFIAPEQSFDSSTVDGRADIYSLGGTFYFALTGLPPFPEGSGGEKIEAHRNSRPRPIRELVPDVPPEVAAILERMTAKRPERRFQTAAELARALEPHARPGTIEFDFDLVLRLRAKEARKRRRERSPGRKRTGASSVAALHSPISSLIAPGRSSAAMRAAVETAVARDTQPSLGGGLQPPLPRRVAFDDAATEEAVRREFSQTIAAASAGRTDEATRLVSLDDGTVFPLTGERIVVGRDAGCEVQLAATGVSGRHCEIVFEEGGWRIVDLDSKNGIRVNGKGVKEQRLRHRDRLTIARSCRFRFIEPAAERRRRRIKLAVISALAAAAGLAALIGALL